VRVIALLDGRAVDALPLGDPGVLLGDAVFETMRSYGGRVFSLDAHLERLARSAKWARISTQALPDEIATLAKRIEGDAAVRVFLFRAHRLVTAEPLSIDPAIYEGVMACVLPNADFGTPESAHAKYARYLPRLLARQEASGRGCGEALLADDAGAIVSAATGSVFALVDGVLVTSSVLEGITRAHVLRLARDARIECLLRPIESSDVARASELFVTSSLREIVPVVRVGERTIGTGKPGTTTRALHAAYRALTA
jgi:branched-chain amino acid aminotransferase